MTRPKNDILQGTLSLIVLRTLDPAGPMHGQVMSQAEGEGQGKSPLVHVGNLQFGASFDPRLRLTFIAENGKIARLRLEQGGGTMEGPRRP